MLKPHYDTKFERIMGKHGVAGSEAVVIDYILDNGIDKIKKITEEDFEEIASTTEENSIISKEYQLALLKAAMQACSECSRDEIKEYIRCYLTMGATQVSEVTLYKEDFTDGSWSELLSDLRLDEEDEVGEVLSIWAILPTEA